MDIENFKRWHWVVIGLFLGAVFAVWRGFWGPNLDGISLIRPEGTETVFREIQGDRRKVIVSGKYEDVPPYFDFDIMNPAGEPMPFFANLLIIPGKPSEPPGRQWIKGTLYRLHRAPGMDHATDKTHAQAEDFVYETDTPFLPRPNFLIDDLPKGVKLTPNPNYDKSKVDPYQKYRDIQDRIWKIRETQADIRKGKLSSNERQGQLVSLDKEAQELTQKLAEPNPTLTVRYYLDQLKAKYPQWGLHYRYAWEYVPWVNWTICLGGMLILVGGIWPTLLQLMIGSGWGHSPEEKERRIKLTKSTSHAPSRGQTGPSAADMAKVVAMGDELEKKLTADGVLGQGSPSPVAAADSKSPSPAAKLPSAPLPPLQKPAAAGKPQDNKEFGASEKDFYPTEVRAPSPQSKQKK